MYKERLKTDQAGMHHAMSLIEQNSSGWWSSAGETDHREHIGSHAPPKPHSPLLLRDTEYWTRPTTSLT